MHDQQESAVKPGSNGAANGAHRAPGQALAGSPGSQANTVPWSRDFAGSEHPETARLRLQRDYIATITSLKRERADQTYTYLSSLIDKAKEEIRLRYDSEKARWKRLKGGMPAGTLLDEEGQVAAAPELRSQIVGQSQILPGRPRGIATCEGKVYECTLNIIYVCRGPNVGGPGVNQLGVKCLEDKR